MIFIETDAKIFWAQLGWKIQRNEEILRGAGRRRYRHEHCIRSRNIPMIIGAPIRFVNDKVVA